MIQCRQFVLRICVAIVVVVLSAMPAFALENPKPIRAFHIVLLGVSPIDAKRMVDQAADQRFNTLIVNVLWGASVKLKSFPWAVQTKPWERDELIDFVRYARAKGIEVVPQMPLLSHQQVLLGKYRPDLMYNQQTYDPSKQEVYQIVLPMLDELVDLIHPKAVNIGHDEVVGWDKSHFGKFLKEGEHALPAELFLKDVMILHDHLKKKGIATWMWGDMLVAPDELPGMETDSLHGQLAGYGKPLRDKLPRDIVICDWHYSGDQKDFLSLSVFREAGFRVLGATWEQSNTIRNFSHYAATHGAEGMIATTWADVQNKEWDKVERIIRESGEAFSKDFPDAK